MGWAKGRPRGGGIGWPLGRGDAGQISCQVRGTGTARRAITHCKRSHRAQSTAHERREAIEGEGEERRELATRARHAHTCVCACIALWGRACGWELGSLRGSACVVRGA